MNNVATQTLDEIIRANFFPDLLKSSRTFCEFIETANYESEFEFLRKAQICLHSLYINAQMLPWVELKHNVDFKDILDEQDSQPVLLRLADQMKNRFYWKVDLLIKEETTEPGCGDLLDDFGDIYKELKNVLLWFDKGTPADMEAAVWQLKWEFDNHWGDHCVNAIYTIHYFMKEIVSPSS